MMDRWSSAFCAEPSSSPLPEYREREREDTLECEMSAPPSSSSPPPTRPLFLRLLGVIYLIAFISLFVQIDGLIGSDGILPASSFVDGATRFFGKARWWQLPTLAYLNPSDAFLHGLCIAGIIGSCLL